jgi:CRISPR-associated protein Cas6
MNTPAATRLDVAFPLQGHALPRDHRLALAHSVSELLPWLADDPQAAVHPVKLVHGSGEPALLSSRSRLMLRVARERAAELHWLAGSTLHVAGHQITLGEPQLRELLPHTTLYAHFVDAGGADEAGFLDAIGAELQQLDVSCHRVCGREQEWRGPQRPLHGFSLMLHGLRAAAALRVLEHGLGAHRLLGCGVFVPHKSAAAVGD